jgi:hypothetical protein
VKKKSVKNTIEFYPISSMVKQKEFSNNEFLFLFSLEQYEGFVRFTQDQLTRRFSELQFSCKFFQYPNLFSLFCSRCFMIICFFISIHTHISWCWLINFSIRLYTLWLSFLYSIKKNNVFPLFFSVCYYLCIILVYVIFFLLLLKGGAIVMRR